MNYLQSMAGRLGQGMGIDPRRRMARQLFAQGVDTSPAHLGTGIGRLGKALIASLMMKESMGQEADTMEWLTAKDPGRTRPPTEAEAYAASPDLQKLHFASTRPSDSLAELYPKGLEHLRDQPIVGEQQEPLGLDPLSAPQEEDPLSVDRIDKDLRKELAEIESGAGFEEEMARIRSDPTDPFYEGPTAPSPSPTPTTGGPRDYAQELKRGMTAYQGAEANQISDPRTRMEWLRESYRNNPELQNNWFANRLIQNMMVNEIARGDEDIKWERGQKAKTEAATLAHKRSREPMTPEQFEQKKQLREAGKVTYQTMIVDGKPVQVDSRGKVSALPKAPVSKAVDVVDKEFGKFYVKHFATGGVHDAIKNLDQLDSVIRRLNAVVEGTSEENLTGPVIGQRPDFLSSMVNPAQVDTQNLIEEVVQRNLRVVLGAQFTEKEGERLIARAYNPKLGEAENAVRVQRLVNAMRNTLNSQMKAAEYYEKNNTLAGWKGTHTLSVGDLYKIIDGDESQLTTGEFGNVKFSKGKDRRGGSSEVRVPEGWDPKDWEHLTEKEKREAWGGRR